MKKLAISTLLFLILTLTACSSVSSSRRQFDPGALGSSNQTALSETSELLVGTYKLEGTKQVVTPKQASELVLYWQVYKDLSASDSAAQEEKDGLVAQIKAVMTLDQITAITNMKLTQRDVFTVMEELGVVAARQPNGNTQGNGSSANGNRQNGNNFGPPDGGFPGGETGGGNFNPQQIATAQAARSQNGGSSSQISTMLLDAFIKYLQTKAGTAS